jgi:hypothetical protein
MDETVMTDKWTAGRRMLVLAGLGALVLPALAATDPKPAAAKAKPAPAAAPVRKTSPYLPESLTKGARSYYTVVSGVDDMKVRRTGSNLIKFSYKVVDPERAKVLADKKATPYLIGHRSRAVLQVPVMDKVGALRQASTLNQGQEYWMVFSNKGDVVKAGERVSVVVGSFRADGLKVE